MIAQLWTRRRRAELAESIVAVVDPKWKADEVPTGNPQKKRKKSKPPIEETPKKAKLLSSSMYVA